MDPNDAQMVSSLFYSEHFYPMNEGAGAVVYDGSGNAHGAITGATWVPGPTGKVLRFASGSADGVLFPSIIGVGDVTFSLWVGPTTGEGYDWLLIGGGNQQQLFIVAKESLNFCSHSGVGVSFVVPASSWISGWNHIVITRTATGLATAYQNGVALGAAQESGIPVAETTFTLGNNPTNVYAHPGDFGAVAVYGALTAEQIGALFAEEKGAYGL